MKKPSLSSYIHPVMLVYILACVEQLLPVCGTRAQSYFHCFGFAPLVEDRATAVLCCLAALTCHSDDLSHLFWHHGDREGGGGGLDATNRGG